MAGIIGRGARDVLTGRVRLMLLALLAGVVIVGGVTPLFAGSEGCDAPLLRPSAQIPALMEVASPDAVAILFWTAPSEDVGRVSYLPATLKPNQQLKVLIEPTVVTEDYSVLARSDEGSEWVGYPTPLGGPDALTLDIDLAEGDCWSLTIVGSDGSHMGRLALGRVE